LANETAAKKKSARHASALKRARKSLKLQARNTATKSKVKTFEKHVLKAIQTKNVEEAKKALKLFMTEADKAAQKGVVHVKRAARRIGRLSKQVSALAK
jgi:small subunit ribosomal protein S20